MSFLVEKYDYLLQAFIAYMTVLEELCIHINTELASYSLQISDGEGFIENRNKVIFSLKNYATSSNIAPQETWACPGAVGSNLKTLTLIDTVNQAKDTFKKAAEACKEVHSSSPTKRIRDFLAKQGYGHIKLKQVYRHIRYVRHSPRRIAWSQGKAYSHLRMTVHEAYNSISKVGQGDNIDVQIDKLNQLALSEKLVKRRAMKPYWIVNIASYPNNEGKVSNQKIATSLPLFYLYSHLHVPEVCFGKKAKRSENIKRSDQQVENLPFLKSISVYRYKDKFKK
jgi:hypothetical protein